MRGFKNPSVMNHDFSRLPQVSIPRSNFRRSHGLKTAFDSGYIIPILADECLPGDSVSLKLSTVARLITPIVPIMDNIQLDFFFFFVPNRLVWEHWKDFMGEHDAKGAQDYDYTVPQVTCPAGGFLNESLFDYLGVPTKEDGCDVNALHSRAYNLIWNDWFRAQDVQDPVTVDLDDANDTDTDYVLLKRNKRHDYFTSCQPYAQKGDEVDLPLGATAPVIGNGTTIGLKDSTNVGMIYNASSSALSGATDVYGQPKDTTSSTITGLTDMKSVGLSLVASTSGMIADLASATAATISELREAFQLQRMMEKDSRSGTRYIELLRAHFGVTSPDARLQRPEYLGGGSTNITIQPIPQTSETGTTEQGTLAAIGFQQHSGISFSKSFVEHGVLLGLCCARCDLTYQQGLDRQWTRQSKYDYFWPSLQHLSEQSVLNKEIYYQNHADDELVFGYQERYAEYRYKRSGITGKLRSNDAASLDLWHLSQEFSSLPTLQTTFLEEDPPIDRITAVTNEPQIKMDCWFDMVYTRPMAVRAIPGLIDHF